MYIETQESGYTQLQKITTQTHNHIKQNIEQVSKHKHFCKMSILTVTNYMKRKNKNSQNNT